MSLSLWLVGCKVSKRAQDPMTATIFFFGTFLITLANGDMRK